MIHIPHVRDKVYYVVGLGKTGVSAAQALIRSGAIVWVWDDQIQQDALPDSLKKRLCMPENLNWDSVAELVLSPGIPHSLPHPHPAAQIACERKIPIICDIELFFRACQDSYLIGITGSHGKSTTTALLGHVLKEAGKEVAVGGNLGEPVLDLRQLSPQGIYVIELSSFQLERCFSEALNAAVLLNISENHLDRHGTMEAYCAAKERIFHLLKNKGTAFCGFDFFRMKGCLGKNLVLFSGLSFVPKGNIYVDQSGDLIDLDHKKTVVNLKKNSCLSGEHNFENFSAVYSVVSRLNLLDFVDFTKGLQSFKGLPHRQEFLGKIGRVMWVNDSKATTLQAATQSLRQHQKVYWLMGGLEKKGFEDISALLPFQKHVEKVFLFGHSARAYADLFKKIFSYQVFETLQEASYAAFQEASAKKEEATILLAPACASYDQFKNFEQRGEVFRKIFEDLAQKQSAVKR